MPCQKGCINMKIIINYELMDKVQEAKTGFSLKKYKHKLGFYLGIVGLARFSAVAIGGMPIEEALEGMIFPTIYGSSYFGLHDWVDSKFKKERSEQELRELSQRLRDIFVETDSELLKESFAYKTEYKINSEKFPPKLEEHKYIMVPVHNDALIPFDINAESDVKYKELLRNQAVICNRMKADIYDRASRTYFDVVNNKNKFLVGISCDFRKLEAACKTYKKDFKPKKRIPVSTK